MCNTLDCLAMGAGIGSGETHANSECAIHYIARLWGQALAVVRHTQTVNVQYIRLLGYGGMHWQW